MSSIEQIKTLITDIEDKDELSAIIAIAMCRLSSILSEDEGMDPNFTVVGDIDHRWIKLQLIPEPHGNTGVRYDYNYYISEGID